jgi:hypothetical protein
MPPDFHERCNTATRGENRADAVALQRPRALGDTSSCTVAFLLPAVNPAGECEISKKFLQNQKRVTKISCELAMEYYILWLWPDIRT